MTDPVLELLRRHPDLAALAAFPFQFDLERARHVEDVHLASGAPLEPIAGDDTGGTYFLCEGGAVLHASSEGDAALLADSVGEALEILIRLPWWCEEVSADLGEDELAAVLRAGDTEAKEEFAPELDEQRARLLAGLGLPDRPLTELVARSEAAALRTEPDHVLLGSAELRAYRVHESARRPLREVVLGPGREALERMRAGDAGARETAAGDPVLRAGVLHAASYDPRDDDLPLLRLLLAREDAERTEWYAERWLAAALVAPHARDADIPLLGGGAGGAGAPPPRAGGGGPPPRAGAVAFARAAETRRREREGTAEEEFAWADLALRQERVAHARIALIRLLDDTGPDADRLRRLSRALERAGDHAQAARARADLLSLQDTAAGRASQAYVLARLERLKGDLEAAGHALERARRRSARTVPGAGPRRTPATPVCSAADSAG
ncbi:hypothetical protein ACFXA4_29255 [Streptomyces sp. NPDC059442]|uniref:hypothetical protein n=1 Tax=Streptomyces sp. NPDC059442 TaxID=3346830 RepID=UPI00369BD4AD